MTKKFNVGDKVRILDASKIMGGFSRWENGEITEVVSFREGYPQLRINHGKYTGLKLVVTSGEFDYIEKVAEHVTKKQRLSALEQQVAELQAEVATLKQASKPTESASAEFIAKLSERSPRKKMSLTPNELRKAIIAEAKAFVDDALLAVVDGQGDYRLPDGSYVQFETIVNAEKRTVVVLAESWFSGKVRFEYIAKCAPDDVFNADIGKAIALGRALGLDVKQFEQAVKPTEVVVGMAVIGGGDKAPYQVVPDFSHKLDVLSLEFCLKYSSILRILDDTDAQY